ncbi:MAG TPA: DEAD/DEAH box helicase, partial [Thermoanaerobaculia bacterium]|nr:DEAD/DEAH box helicase [Thermoanaerobaculia bacterium]
MAHQRDKHGPAGGDGGALALFHPAVRDWFKASFSEPTRAQTLGWPAIASGQSTLILAPTGSGKTLTAFLWSINRLMFSPLPPRQQRCRVLYISPLKALAVDVERNLRAPLAGVSNLASSRGESFVAPAIAVRTGDTPPGDRRRFLREPADILITTPESVYLLLTSNARELLRSVETVIVDEIHALVPNKRGVHLAISLERLNRICAAPPQRIGLSATQRPLDEVAHFLGGFDPEPIRSARRASTKTSSRAPAPSPEVQLHEEFASQEARSRFRPVTIVDTAEKKQLSLRVEVPVEEMAKLGDAVDIQSGPAVQGPGRASIWPAIHPRLLEL